MHQPPLIRGHHLPSVYQYAALFEPLPRLCRAVVSASKRGRKSYPEDTILRMLIYRCLRQIPTLSELVFELNTNPALVEALGLDPLKSLPSVERFSSFLRRMENTRLQQVRQTLVQALITQGTIPGKSVAIDSCPVIVQVRENNLKTRLSGRRFDKSQPPKGDRQSGVGVRIHFPGQSKAITYFWGYRNHTVTDAQSELPLCEETYPANVSEVARAKPLLQAVRDLGLPVTHVLADAEYDVEAILLYIVNELHAQPIVAHNPRNEKVTEYSIRKGQIICAAGLPMASRGTVTPKQTGITYRQYSCPIYWLKEFQRQYLCCPVGHPKFVEQKGCNVLIRTSASVRAQIPYGTPHFQNLYHQRTAAERSYSRLLSITMQHPTVRGLTAIRNHCTIAHIATLLVALKAANIGEHEKIRCIKSFVPRFLKN